MNKQTNKQILFKKPPQQHKDKRIQAADLSKLMPLPRSTIIFPSEYDLPLLFRLIFNLLSSSNAFTVLHNSGS